MAKQVQNTYIMTDNAALPQGFQPSYASQNASDTALDTILEIVADPNTFELKQATKIVKSAILQDPDLEAKLVRIAVQGKRSADEVIRIIRILECTCTKVHLLSYLLSLESASHPRIRSKVALTIGRLVQNTAWLKEQMQVSEPRVRANAVEALWGVRVEGAESLLLDASLDPNNRVVGNAAYGLYRLGNVKAISVLYSLLRRPEKLFRSTGLWAVTQTGDPRFLPSLQSAPTEHLEEADERRLRERACRYLKSRVKSSQFAGTLTLNLADFKTSPGQIRTARMSCVSSEPGIWFGATHLNALNFVVEEDGKQIEEFECRWIAPSQKLCAVAVVPVSLSPHSWPLHVFSNQASKDESVSVLSYLPSSAVVTREHRNWLAADESTELSTSVGSYRFSAINDFHAAVVNGLETLNSSPDARHLFIVLDSSCEDALPAAVNKLVRSSGSVVHVLAASDVNGELTGALREFSHKSGGTFLTSGTADPLPGMASAVRARHTSSFELSWAGIGRNLSKVRIECISDCGYGEVAIVR